MDDSYHFYHCNIWRIQRKLNEKSLSPSTINVYLTIHRVMTSLSAPKGNVIMDSHIIRKIRNFCDTFYL